MAAIDSSVRQIWQAWMTQYRTAPTKEAKDTALANLQALDVWDDGQKNNSIDSSFDAWDIKEKPPEDTGALTDAQVQQYFDKWWAQLPKETQDALTTKYAGDNKQFSPEEMREVVSYIASKAGWEEKLTQDEIAAIGDDVDDKGDTRTTDQKYQDWIKQLPDDVRQMVESSFGNGTPPLTQEEKKRAIEYIESKAGGDTSLSNEEIDAIKAGLDKPRTKEDFSKKYDKWISQLPEDVRKSIESSFGDGKNPLNDDQKKAAAEYMASKGDWDDKLTDKEIAGIKAGLNKPESKDEIDKRFEEWWPKLPDDVKQSLKEKFGSEIVTNYDSKKKVVEYLGGQIGWDEHLSDDDIKKVRTDLGMPTTPAETNAQYDSWIAQLPPDDKKRIETIFGGEGNDPLTDDEKKKAVEFMASKAGWNDKFSEDDIVRIRAGAGEPTGIDEKVKKFQAWWDKLPEDVRAAMDKRFGGDDHKVNDLGEKTLVADYIATVVGWEDDLSNEDVDKIKFDMKYRPIDLPEFRAKFEKWWTQLPSDVQELLKSAYGGADYPTEEIAIVKYIASQVGWEDDLSKEDIDKIKANVKK